MSEQEIINQFYQELVAINAWETRTYKLQLVKGGLIIKSKINEKQVILRTTEGTLFHDKDFDKLAKSL